MNQSQLYEALAGVLRVMERYPDTHADLVLVRDALNVAATTLLPPPALPARRQLMLERFAELWRKTQGMDDIERREAIMQRLPCGRTYFYDLREEAQERGLLD